ncbi:MAG: TIGR04076 family protein [Chloroflexi bacterium]|nr:TIGR04076 family protein [Chloroflexota bacterium]
MPNKTRITVVSVGGHCAQGHTVGQQWEMEGKSPAGLCMSALGSLLPRLTALRFDAQFPWATEDKDAIVVACPDAKNPVVFELRRIKM